MTTTSTVHEHNSHAHKSHDHPTPTRQTDSFVGKRTANLTLETPLLVAAITGLLAGLLAFPDVALILLGIPTVILLGVGTIVTAARLLAR